MTEKMRDGIIKRGEFYYYVVREHGHFAAKDRKGQPKLDADGAQIYVSVRQRWMKGAKTRTATVALRDKARSSTHDGTYVAPQDLTVSAWLDRWIEAHEVELKPSTAASYRDKIRLYIKPAIGHQRVQSLSPTGLSTVWRTMQTSGGKNGKPIARRTVEFARAVLRKALEDAVVERVIQVNPVVGSKMAKPDGKPVHTTWTGSQISTFLRYSTTDRWHAMWTLFFATGMRRGEVAGLLWEDESGPVIDLDAGTVRVERSTTQLGNERVTTTPKNHERRTVSIDASTVTVLRAWRAKQAAERLRMGPAYVETDGVVFTWPDGRPVMPDYITKTFPKVQAVVCAQLSADAVAAGSEMPAQPLPVLVVHEARHSHATVLLRLGVPVHVVAKRLGHKDPSVTLDVYADAIPEDDANAVDVYFKAVHGGA